MSAVSNWFRAYGFADVLEDLVIGAYPLDAEDVSMLEWMGVQRVLNLCQDEEYHPGEREEVQAAMARAGIEERRIETTDFGDLPPEALDAAVRQVSEWLDEHARVYLHCRAGRQRSAAVAAGVLAQRDGIDPDVALARVQARKPSAEPLPHQVDDLRLWWQQRQGTQG